MLIFYYLINFLALKSLNFFCLFNSFIYLILHCLKSCLIKLQVFQTDKKRVELKYKPCMRKKACLKQAKSQTPKSQARWLA